jgi:hypothetical protein
MTAAPLAEQVCWLLREHLTMFEQLEALLYLRIHQGSEYDLTALGDALGIQPEHLIVALNGLLTSGLIAVGSHQGLYRFAPHSAELIDAVELLALAYREQSAAVLSTMSVNAIERIRSGPMRAFADSFVLGGKKRNG